MADAAIPGNGYFDTLYRADDPFGYRASWYEQRKRQLLVASLPQRMFANAWEIGCSNGELTAALAPHCRALLATDISARAVELASQRNRQSPHVSVQCAVHPDQWPSTQFDLIVLSEVGYYLSADALEESIGRIRNSLTDEGVFVACHWLAPFEEASFTGREVHDRIAHRLDLSRVYRYEDGDFLLEAWSASTRTLAEREGLK
jgi:SAM-dependent methyltransferase